MAYWMLVVSRDGNCPSLDTIEVPLFSDFDADYDVRQGTELDWREIELSFATDQRADDFATIYRHVDPKSIAKYLEGWRESLAHAEPRRAASWLRQWLSGARTVYSFTPHHRNMDKAMAALRVVIQSIRLATGGIAYAEGEGWSNDDGYLVTWEFDREQGLAGNWRCAVLDAEERWVGFQIELGNPHHRKAFREGRVPDGLRATSMWPV
jgi:hypothetical protein